MKQTVELIAVLIALIGIVPLSQGNLVVAGVLYCVLLGIGGLYTLLQHNEPAPHHPDDNG